MTPDDARAPGGEIEEAGRSGGPGAPVPPGGFTVLVVDDEPDMRESIARILRRAQYTCVAVPTVREALTVLDHTPMDLILTDLRMPGADGLTLVREARRRVPGTPVVIVTAYATDVVAEGALRAGAVALLPKPFTAGELLETARRALEGRGLATGDP
jgi:CheY-like chemotaxis protein